MRFPSGSPEYKDVIGRALIATTRPSDPAGLAFDGAETPRAPGDGAMEPGGLCAVGSRYAL